MDRPEILEITDPDSELAKQAFSLYEKSFPIECRLPVETLAGILRSRHGQIEEDGTRAHSWVAVNKGAVNGLILYDYYRDDRLGYLFYIATDPKLRGQGLGTWLFRRAVEELPRDAQALGGEPPLGLFWEVERPQDAETEEEREIGNRRIRFYERAGGVLLDRIEYLAPPLGEGLPSVYYYLMFAPLSEEASPDDPLLLRRMVDIAYLRGYGVGPEDPFYQQAIDSIGMKE